MVITSATAVNGIGVLATALAAAFWLWASVIKVPDNMDTFIEVLQKIGRLNASGAMAASVAALCLLVLFVKGLLQ